MRWLLEHTTDGRLLELGNSRYVVSIGAQTPPVAPPRLFSAQERIRLNFTRARDQIRTPTLNISRPCTWALPTIRHVWHLGSSGCSTARCV